MTKIIFHINTKAPNERVKNTKRNIIFSYVSAIITMIFQFVSRTLIVYTLGDSYLGLSSLFTSILSVLSMAELGFSGAIIYNLYKPLADNDTDKVCALLAYFRKIYRIVGVIVFFAGIFVLPFLPKLIKDDIPADMNLYMLYMLFLLNTTVSYYLFAYKISLLDALQRTDLIKIAYTISSAIQYVLQIISIAVFKNYYLYLGFMILGTILNNVLSGYISKSKYSEYECKGEVDRETKKDIIGRVKGLLVGRISGVTYTTFDSIIISSFIGLTAVAVYNNYMIVYASVSSFIALIRAAMQASVGNSIASESKEKNYQDMMLWQFLFSVIATWCVACMVSMYQPFMILWMGSDHLLNMTDVVLLCMCIFEEIISYSFFLYLSGNGLWWEMRWPYILSTVCNLLLNIILGKFFGTTGIIFATLFVGFVFGFIWQSKIIFRLYFEKSTGQFMRRFILYSIVCLIATALAYGINQFIVIEGIPGLVIKFIICTIISVIVMFITYWKSEVFKQALSFARYIMTKKY